MSSGGAVFFARALCNFFVSCIYRAGLGNGQ